MQKGMPPFTSLTADQRWDLVAYLYTLSIPEDRLDRGKAVYADKCTACHGATGKPDAQRAPGAPDLSDPAQMAAKSQADFDGVIANGRGAMPGLGTYRQDDKLAVADYVRSLSMALNKVVLPTGQAAIVGSIVNGTAGAKTPGNLPLTLYALSPDGSTLMYTRTAQTDANGQFTFDKLETSASIMYGIQTFYLKASYVSDPLTFVHGGLTLTVPITVYETTTDVSGVRVDQMHLFFEFLEPGRTSVGQLFIVSNSADRAYMGADGTSVHLPLPPGATNVQFQDGELGGRYQQVKEGFADTDAVAPGTGTTQILVSYDLPYDGKKLDINLPVVYAVKSINVLVPEGGIKLTSAQLTLAGSRAVQGGNMVNFVGGDLDAGSTLAMQLSGAATVAVPGAVSTSAGTAISPVLIVAVALLLVSVAIVAFVWLRQQRAAAEGVEEEIEDADAEAQQDGLLSEIAALDDDFDAGRIQEKVYREQRAALKAELKELMQ
jgi:mono/diheme cytochrome c family protein